jgi:hypothetical protein
VGGGGGGVCREKKTIAPSKATMKVLFFTMICAVLAIILTVYLLPTPGAGATRTFLTSSKGYREPAPPTEAAVDNNKNNDKNKNNDQNNIVASRDHDSQPTTTTKATVPTVTTTKATTATTGMRQQRPSRRRHRSLLVTNLFAWIKKIFCYLLGQKFGLCSPPTPTCRTGPTPFTNRQQLDAALAEFFTKGYTDNLQQYGGNMNEWDVSTITNFSFLFFLRDI